jgi:hypothetical protein
MPFLRIHDGERGVRKHRQHSPPDQRLGVDRVSGPQLFELIEGRLQLGLRKTAT